MTYNPAGAAALKGDEWSSTLGFDEAKAWRCRVIFDNEDAFSGSSRTSALACTACGRMHRTGKDCSNPQEGAGCDTAARCSSHHAQQSTVDRGGERDARTNLAGFDECVMLEKWPLSRNSLRQI